MTEHTKGEWWFQEDLIQKAVSEEEHKKLDMPPSQYKHISVHGTWPGGILVAYCGCHEETEANARLIAAAPALLAACERITKLADKALRQNEVERGKALNEIGNIAEQAKAKESENG